MVAFSLDFKTIVDLILNCKTEEAIQILSEYYGVEKPKLKVGIPKGNYKALAVYDPSKNTIYFSKGEYLCQPFVVLHEFYHVIRMFGNKHKGNEKKANEFALNFLRRFYKVH